MSAPASWLVRAMQPADLGEVVQLAAEEPAAPHWPPPEFDRMLQAIAEAPARRGAWVLLGPRADDRLAGFAMASHVAGICDLEAVVVRAACRGQRGGQALVSAASAWARALGASRVELEVRVSNRAALRLYGRLGFAEDGRRPGYYCNPEEDAVLMSLEL